MSLVRPAPPVKLAQLARKDPPVKLGRLVKLASLEPRVKPGRKAYRACRATPAHKECLVILEQLDRRVNRACKVSLAQLGLKAIPEPQALLGQQDLRVRAALLVHRVIPEQLVRQARKAILEPQAQLGLLVRLEQPERPARKARHRRFQGHREQLVTLALRVL